jgi:hypothetical protein
MPILCSHFLRHCLNCSSVSTLILRKQQFLSLFYLQPPSWLPWNKGRAIAQGVSRWLPTAAARVRSRIWSREICGGQSGSGARFLRVLRSPPPIFIPPIAPQSPSSIIWGWYKWPVVAAVPSGPSLTPLRIIKPLNNTLCNVYNLKE